MKVNYSLWILIVVSALSLGYVIFSNDWERKEIEVGFSDEVNKSPFTMATRLLAKHGVSWQSQNNIRQLVTDGELNLATDHALLLDESVLAKSMEIDSSLYDWVIAGGRVIYILSPQRDSLALDESKFVQALELNVNKVEEGYSPYFLFSRESKENATFTVGSETVALTLNSTFSIDNCPSSEYQNNLKAIAMCDLSLGEGRVTVIPSISQFTNTGLRYLDHGAFLVWLSQGSRELVYIPNLTNPSWLANLWHWGWQWVIAVFLLLAALMWRTSARFGLPYTPIKATKTAFKLHIEALAHFYQQHGHEKVLLNALINDFNNKAEIRIPHFKQLSVEQQAQMISRITQYDKSTLIALLSSDYPESKQQRTEYIKQFKQLRNAL